MNKRKLWRETKTHTIFAIRKNLIDNTSAELLLHWTRSEWLMAKYSVPIGGSHALQLILNSFKHTIPTMH